MNVGKFRHLITIENKTGETVDDYARRIPSWAPFKQVYAQVADVSGREFYEAAAYQLENVVTFTFRWVSGLTAAMRITWGGDVYEIVQINHLGYRRDFLRIKARSVGAKEAAPNGQL